MPSIKSLDEELVLACAAKTGTLVTIEEHNIIGGLGSGVFETLCAQKPVQVGLFWPGILFWSIR